MAPFALVLGMLIVWTFGYMVVAVLIHEDDRARTGGVSLAIGTGWFVGAFLVTLWMRVLSLVHVPFGAVSIGAPILLLAIALAWLHRKHWSARSWPWRSMFVRTELPQWQRVAWGVLLAWLVLRFGLLLGEIVWRPLYPWDAWTQWSTKARVWFELKRMAPFVDASQWLAATNADVYFDAAPHYPGTVPLLQVLSATLLGEWNDALINLPWWITGVAFAFAMYGILTAIGFGALPALVGTWLVVSLPILDVHVALAGYADLAMCTYLTLAALFALRAVQSRRIGDIVLAATLFAACAVIKNPGKVWLVTLLPGLIAAAWPRYAARIAGISLGAALGLMLLLAQTEPVILGYRLHLEFDMPWSALAEAYFAFGNWHLLWYGCVAIAILGWRQLLSPAVAPYTLFVAAGLLFLMFGFAFTNARLWVEDQSTVNRATLHLAPLAIVWMLVAFRAWSQARDARTPEAAVTPAPASAA